MDQKQFASQLQEAYVKAGEDMGKQMAETIVALISEMSAGVGHPKLFGFPIADAPAQLLGFIPEDKLEEASWVYIVAEDVEDIPLTSLQIAWTGHLTSGHRVVLI